MPDKQEKLLEQIRQSYQKVFTTPEGVIVLKDLENRTGIHHSTFDPDPYKAANLEGMRAVTLFIHSMLKPLPKEKKQNG
tara:strand:+ start:164 stop:400 length:237 start_codon:yes stop_codon:yes gene_type:complete